MTAARRASRPAAGRRTRRTRAGPARAPARTPPGTGTAPPRQRCTAGRSPRRRSRPVSPAAAARAGRAEPARRRRRRPATCCPVQSSTSSSVSITVSRRIIAGLPAQAANLAMATEIRSSSPSSRIRCPASACASCMRSTRLSLVGTVQCVWSSSAFAPGAPSAACCERSARPASSAGMTTPRPPQAGQLALQADAAGGRRDRLPAGGGEPDRPLGVDDAALAQLVAGGGDDRDRQLGQPGDLAHRGGLRGQHRRQNVADARFALRQAHRRGNLGHRCVHVHDRTSSHPRCFPPRVCGLRRSGLARGRGILAHHAGHGSGQQLHRPAPAGGGFGQAPLRHRRACTAPSPVTDVQELTGAGGRRRQGRRRARAGHQPRRSSPMARSRWS